ncbi:MAG: TlpA disulfide reductase family protein [Myxococcota bacterium]
MVARIVPLVVLAACTPRLYTSGGTDTEWSWEAPANDWPTAAPPEGTRGQGLSVGQTVPDLRLADQFGNEVSLWQFHGRVVLVDISTMWCAPCQELANSTESTQQRFGADEFVYTTVLQENVESQPPTTDDLNVWADFFGITAPVLADGEKITGSAVQNGQYPALLLIGPDLVVHERINPVDEATVDAAIEELLGG